MNNDADVLSKKVENNRLSNSVEDEPDPRSSMATKSVRLDFSVEIHELLTRSESDPTSAVKLLLMHAAALRAGMPTHPMLADFIASAIESAAAKPSSAQARAITDGLRLTSQIRRPVHSWLEVGNEMYMLISAGMSQTQAKVEVAVKYEIDETTAVNYYKKYIEGSEDAVSSGNM